MAGVLISGSAVADAFLYVRGDTASANISTGYRFKLTAAGAPSIQTWNAQNLVTGATVTAPSIGDTIGFSCFGPLLQAFYKIGAGAWTEILRCYDTLYAGAGFVGMELATLGRVDAFGGGPMNIAQPSSPLITTR